MAHILEIELPDGRVRPEDLDHPACVLGRDDRCEIRLAVPSVSRRHARFIREDDTITLEDLGGRNGTFLNGERVVEPRVLCDGDTLRFGSIGARYHSSATAEVQVGSGIRSRDEASSPGQLAAEVASRRHWRNRLRWALGLLTLAFAIVTTAALWWAGRDEWMHDASATMAAFAADNRAALQAGDVVAPTGGAVLGHPAARDPVVMTAIGEVVWPASRRGESWDGFAANNAGAAEQMLVVGPADEPGWQRVLYPVESVGTVVGWVGAAWDTSQGRGETILPWLSWLAFTWLSLMLMADRVVERLIARPLRSMVEDLRKPAKNGRRDVFAPGSVPELVEIAATIGQLSEASEDSAGTEPSARLMDIERWFGGFPLPVVLTDHNYRVVTANPPARRVFGYRGAMTGDVNLATLLPRGSVGPAILNALERLEEGETAELDLTNSAELELPFQCYLGRAIVPGEYKFALVLIPQELTGRRGENETVSFNHQKAAESD